MTEERILMEIVHPALRTASMSIPHCDLGSFTAETSLFGSEGAVFDSMNLVSFVFVLEDEVLKVTGKKIKIAAADLVGQEKNPFSSLTLLSRLLKMKLENTGK